MTKESKIDDIKNILPNNFLISNAELKWKHAPKGVYLSDIAISSFGLDALGVKSDRNNWDAENQPIEAVGYHMKVLGYQLRESENSNDENLAEVYQYCFQSSVASGGVFDYLVGHINMNGTFIPVS